MRALMAAITAWIRQIGHRHVYTARILSADRKRVVTVPTAFCAVCGKYPR